MDLHGSCQASSERLVCPLTSSLLGLLQPLGQDGLELAGILETELQVLKAADSGLAEL